ncbi:TPA: hypothetical protein ACX6RM_001301 [Photobacterium damselae]
MINKETLSSLLNSSICIENVFYMQLVTACDKLPDSFLTMFKNDTESVLEALGLSGSLVTPYDDDLLQSFYDKAPKGVLIQFKTPVHRDFLFDDNGCWRSCDSSWNYRISLYAYGDSLAEALDNVIKAQNAFVAECVDREKKERGL